MVGGLYMIWWYDGERVAGMAQGVNMDGYSSVVAYAINIPELCIIATLLFYNPQLKMFYKLGIAGFRYIFSIHSFFA